MIVAFDRKTEKCKCVVETGTCPINFDSDLYYLYFNKNVPITKQVMIKKGTTQKKNTKNQLIYLDSSGNETIHDKEDSIIVDGTQKIELISSDMPNLESFIEVPNNKVVSIPTKPVMVDVTGYDTVNLVENPELFTIQDVVDIYYTSIASDKGFDSVLIASEIKSMIKYRDGYTNKMYNSQRAVFKELDIGKPVKKIEAICIHEQLDVTVNGISIGEEGISFLEPVSKINIEARSTSDVTFNFLVFGIKY